MAYARLVFYPGGTEAQFRAVIDALGPAFSDARGRTFFAAGPTDGGWEMVTVWESRECFESWSREYLPGAHQRVGDRGWTTSPQFVDFPVLCGGPG